MNEHTYMMMRAVGAKAVASVEMAVCVPPTMVAGELNAEISEGARERRVERISATAIIRTSTNNHTEWFQIPNQETSGSTPQAIK